MLLSLSCNQYDGWYAFYKNNPWGPHIDGFRNGQLCAAIFNSTGHMKKPVLVDDFIPRFH
jgi:phage major head subunit gpT-like protein